MKNKYYNIKNLQNTRLLLVPDENGSIIFGNKRYKIKQKEVSTMACGKGKKKR